METVIGWDAEEALASRMLDAARHTRPRELPSFEAEMEAGDWDVLVAGALLSGVPISSADARLVRRAWVTGRTDTMAGKLERALASATIRDAA